MGNKKGNKPGRIAVGKGSHDNRFILERFHRLLHTKIHSKYRIHIVILLTWNPLKRPLIGSRNLWKNCILSTIQELKVTIHILTCIWFTLQFHIFAIDQTKLHVLSVSLCCICLYTRTFSRLGFSCLLQQRPVGIVAPCFLVLLYFLHLNPFSHCPQTLQISPPISDHLFHTVRPQWFFFTQSL